MGQFVSFQPSVLSGWLLSVVSGPLSLVSVQSLCGLCFASCHSPLATCLLTGPSTLLSPADGARLGIADGERVRASSRRGSVEVPVRFDATLRPGLAFLTLHFPDQVATNVLTIDATDPKSGTAEFKASAIRVDKLRTPVS